MNRCTLYIDDKEIPTLKGVPISATFSIADVRDPSMRNATFTKTIEIPSTIVIDKIFEFCFEVNLELNNFNPNLKKPARIVIEGFDQMSGNVQLKKIRVNELTGLVIYECNIIGYYADLFYSIGNALLTDLDFSEYDHVLNSTNVNNTWNPAVSPNTNKVSGVDTTVVSGIGYRYPLIDYGLNNGDVSNYYIHHLRPLLFAYEYCIKIAAAAGKTFTSSFLNSSFFKHLAVPCTEVVKADATVRENRECVVGSYNIYLYKLGNVLSFKGGTTLWDGTLSTDVAIYPDESGARYADIGDVYNGSTGEITVATAGKYTVAVDTTIAVIINTPNGAADYVDAGNGAMDVHLQMNTGAGWVTVFVADPMPLTAFSGKFFSYPFQMTYTGFFDIGTAFRVLTMVTCTNVSVRDVLTNLPVTTGSTTFDVGLDADFPGLATQSYSLKQFDDNIFYGDTITLNSTIPSNVKQADFLNSIIKMFNLYIEVDKSNPNNYFIEPRNDFYSEPYVDWTNKFDASFDLEILPMGELDAKNYIHTYKSDSDYYNKSYQDAYRVPYGYHNFEVENEFVKSEGKTELVFSPTPLVGNLYNGLIIPKIYQNSGGAVSHIKTNIRLLYYSGAIGISNGTYKLFVPGAIPTALGPYDTFAYCGHLDDPYNPTLDLNFGVPYEFYYRLFPTFVYTTNTIYKLYHSAYINAISDPNSKLISGRFNLNELDIKNLDFRSPVYFRNAFYYLNMVKDYEMTEQKTTQVELLKLN